MVQQQRLQMGISVVLTGLMMTVVGPRRRKLFKPFLDIGDQPVFQIIDVDGRRNVHGGNKAKSIANPTSRDDFLQLRGNPHNLAAFFCMEKQILSMNLYDSGGVCHQTFPCAAGDDIMVLDMSQSEDSTHFSPEEKYYDAIDRVANGDLTGAVTAFRACLEDDPSMLDAMHGLIRSLQDLGELDEALRMAQRLAEIDPEDVLAHTSLSILYQHKGMIPEAEAEATKAKLLGWKHQLRHQKRASSPL